MTLAPDSAVILKMSDSINQRGWEGCTTSASIFLNGCDKATEWGPEEILEKLGESDTVFGIRAEVGRELSTYDAASTEWIAETPWTEMGPMLISEIEVIEDPASIGGWRIEITSSGMGRIMSFVDHGTNVYRGDPLIRITVAARTRTARAWRIDSPGETSGAVTDPELAYVTDTVIVATPPATGQSFSVSPWKSSEDISGVRVDINGQPVALRIPQRVITLEVVRRGSYHSWTDAAVSRPLYTNAGEDKKKLSRYLWKMNQGDFEAVPGARNTAAFLGYGVGELLLDSVSVTPVMDPGGFKLVTYVFIAEPDWKHAEQIPFAIPGVSTWISTEQDTVYSTGFYHTKKVLWNQPYFTGWMSIEDDWPEDEWDYILAYAT